MATKDGGLTVLDPTVAPLPAEGIVAPRPQGLEGATLGLLANGKRNSDHLLRMVYEVLADRYAFAGVVERNKGDASRPAPPAMLDELAELCDVVITASGD